MALLLSSRPVVVIPELAVRLGLPEAMLLQQIQYWVTETTSGVDHDGRRWIYNTIDGWQKQLPFYSESTIKRALGNLKKLGVLSVEQINKSNHDMTNYYAINYGSELLCDETLSPAKGDEDKNDGAGQNDPIDKTKNARSIRLKRSALNGSKRPDVTENTTEITTEIKRPCQEAELPDGAEPEPECISPERSVLNHLNTVTSSSFRDGKSTTGRIKARLAEGYSVDDLILVTDYLTAKWLNDPKMCDYLRPKTLFGPENCAEYFTMAKKWRDSGRPACVNGKWCINQASAGQLPHWNSVEGWEGFL